MPLREPFLMVLIPLHSGHDGFRFFVHDASILLTLPLNHNAKGAFQAPDCERSRTLPAQEIPIFFSHQKII